MRVMKTLVTLIVLNLILWPSLLLATVVNGWLGLIVGLVVTLVFLVNAIDYVEKEPPHKAVLVFFGRRKQIVLKEGFVYLPIRPFVFDMVVIPVTKVDQVLDEQIVRTPDKVEIGVKISLTWLPGISLSNDTYEPSAESLINYLNTGKEEGVKRQINSMTEDRLRTWAASEQEGPADWEEARAGKDEALGVLLKAVLGDALAQISEEYQSIPTPVWIKYFSIPQGKPSKYQTRMKWATDETEIGGTWNWGGLQLKLKEGKDFPKEDTDKYKELKEAAKKRIKEIEKAKRSDGAFSQIGLGITVVRFAINEISVKGETAKAAELKAKKERERDADATEIKNVIERVKELMTLGVSPQEALRTVRVERKKATERFIDVCGSTTEIGKDLIRFADLLGDAIRGGGGERGEKKGSELDPEKEEGDRRERERIKQEREAEKKARKSD